MEAILANGLRMPMIGLGTWQLTSTKGVHAVREALALGYRHIDTAAIYGNHTDIGLALEGADRRRLFITSKVWYSELHYGDVLASCASALAELRTDYLDLYLIHWPNRSVPMSETFRALEELHDLGKVRAIGVSNFTIEHLKAALQVAKRPIVVNQVEFHPMLYQRELLDFCREHKIQLVAYSPLGHGRLLKDKTVLAIAKRHQRQPSQVILRWILDKGVAVIPKASSREHLAENLDVDFALTQDDTLALDDMPQERFINPGFAEFS